MSRPSPRTRALGQPGPAPRAEQVAEVLFRRPWWSSRPAWLLWFGVLVVVLAIGSVHPVRPSRAARIAGLESEIKCPVCADLSIAQSNAAAAVDLRNEVHAMVEAGATDAAVRARVVSQYGSGVLLVPASSGVDLWIWLTPVLLGVALAGGLGLFLFRRRRFQPQAVPDADDEALVAQALADRAPQEGRR